MKNLVFLLLVAVFSGCSIYPHILHEENYFVTDLRKYSDEGFLISSGDYSGKYESKGFVEGFVFPEVKVKSRAGDQTSDKYLEYGYWLVERITIDDLISKLKKHAKHIGADALIQVSITIANNPAIGQYEDYAYLKVASTGYRINALAIKRKEN
jgi:hypothetical protein